MKTIAVLYIDSVYRILWEDERFEALVNDIRVKMADQIQRLEVFKKQLNKKEYRTHLYSARTNG